MQPRTDNVDWKRFIKELERQNTQRTCQLRVRYFYCILRWIFDLSLCCAVPLCSLIRTDSQCGPHSSLLYIPNAIISILFIASETHSISNSMTLALFSQSHSIIIRAISRKPNISLFFGHGWVPLSRIIRVWPNATFSIFWLHTSTSQIVTDWCNKTELELKASCPLQGKKRQHSYLLFPQGYPSIRKS